MSGTSKLIVVCSCLSSLSGVALAASDLSLTTVVLSACLIFASVGSIFAQLTIANLERRR